MDWRRGFRRSTKVPSLTRSVGDAAAFADFYDAYVDEIAGFFGSRTLEPQLAIDLTAETFATALAKRRQFRGDTEEEERGWLYAIARSHLNHYWRRLEVERRNLERMGIADVVVHPDDLEYIERHVDVQSVRGNLHAAVRELPEDQRRAVLDRIVAEREYEEMAEEYGVSQDVVRARVSRGLRALHAVLAAGTGE